jgi:PKD repeat protein
VNKDLEHVLNATYNYWGKVDGPNSDPILGDVIDPATGYLADGRGCEIANWGLVMFDPWLGIHANINTPAGSTITVEAGEVVKFDATGSYAYCFPTCPDCCNPESQALQYLWDFDDGRYSSNKVAPHVFNSPGTYHVSLMIDSSGFPYYNNFMYDWDYITVVVVQAGGPLGANADGGNLGGYEGAFGEPITFYGSANGGTPPYVFKWDFGDGVTFTDIRFKSDSDSQVTHIYKEDKTATYTVTLTVIDWNSDQVTDTSEVTIYGPEELVLNINVQPNIAQGDSIKFTSTVTGGKGPYTYSWNFGDGILSQQANPTHVYETSGIYTVSLAITDSNGDQKTKTKTVTVKETSGTSEIEINNVKGGLGVKATIVSTSEVSWNIDVEGKVFFGGSAEGNAQGVTQIRIPFTLAFGDVDIVITAGTEVKHYTAFAFGPIFLSVQEA